MLPEVEAGARFVVPHAAVHTGRVRTAPRMGASALDARGTGVSNEGMSTRRNRFLDASLQHLCGAQCGSLEQIANADLELPVCAGSTPLTQAVCAGTGDAVSRLLARANPDTPDLRGATPLIYAAQLGRVDIGRRLLDAGADVDLADLNRRGPIHYALYEGHGEFAELLVRRRADLSRIDIDGRSPIDYARSRRTGKNAKAMVALASTASGRHEQLREPRTPRTPRTPPMRADPDYRLVDLLTRWLAPDALFARARKTCLLCFVAIFGALYLFDTRFDDFMFDGPLAAHAPFAGFAPMAFLISAGVCAAFYLLPFVRGHGAPATAGRAGSPPPTQDVVESSLVRSGTSARAVSGVFKQASRMAAVDLMAQDAVPESGGAIAYAVLFVIAAITALAAGVVILSLGGAMAVFDAVTGASDWLFDWVNRQVEGLGGLIAGAIRAVTLLPIIAVGAVLTVLAGMAYVVGPFYVSNLVSIKAGRWVVTRRLLARQRRQSERINAWLDAEPAGQDAAASVLYLRAFRRDGASRIGEFSVEALLAYSLSRVCPLVALGYPPDRLGPMGVDVQDEVWQATVARLASTANMIVMVLDDSEGVLWEVEFLRQEGLLEKTVFVAPPGDDTTRVAWERMRRHTDLRRLEIPPYCDAGFVFRLGQDGCIASFGPLGLDAMPPPLLLEMPPGKGYDDGDGGQADDASADAWGPTHRADAAAAVHIAAAFAQRRHAAVSRRGRDVAAGRQRRRRRRRR